MIGYALQAMRLLLVGTLVFGLLYPLLVTALAQLAFPWQANGSLLVEQGSVVGSRLVGQRFSAPGYFWPRPSVTSPLPYNAAASAGGNQGPTAPSLAAALVERAAALRAHPAIAAEAPIPVDLITDSASGLDPHISPAAARYQLPRVAAERGLDPAVLAALVEAQVEPR
jgi:K+-transporting ATPase ATPase C chain